MIQSILSAIGSARPLFIAGALALYIVSVAIAAARWRLLLTALSTPVRLADAALANLGGICVNNITISSRIAGEAARIGLLRLRAGVPVPETTAAAALERLSEVPPIAIVLVIAAPALTLVGGGAARVVVLCVVALIAAGVLTAPRWRAAMREWLTRRFGQDRTLLPSRAAMVGSMGWSSLVWVQDVLRIWLIAAGMGVSLTVPQAATLSVVNMIGGWVPTVGGLGAIESGLVGGLMLYGIPFDVAAAITAIERAISYGFGTCAGAAAIAYLGAWRWVRGASAREDAQTIGRQRKNQTANIA